MNAAEIVIREMQGDSGFQVLQLARESVREPGQPPKLHSHRKVCLSTKLVDMCFGSGTPLRTLDITSVILGGE
jgi:hypothetical protein